VVVTVTSTVPDPAGDLAVIAVAEFTVKVVALLGPNATAVASVRLVPRMVTEVPPVPGPALGFTLVTVAGVEANAAPMLPPRAHRTSESSAVAKSERKATLDLGQSAGRCARGWSSAFFHEPVGVNMLPSPGVECSPSRQPPPHADSSLPNLQAIPCEHTTTARVSALRGRAKIRFPRQQARLRSTA
jgi:hypothetical protein